MKNAECAWISESWEWLIASKMMSWVCRTQINCEKKFVAPNFPKSSLEVDDFLIFSDLAEFGSWCLWTKTEADSSDSIEVWKSAYAHSMAWAECTIYLSETSVKCAWHIWKARSKMSHIKFAKVGLKSFNMSFLDKTLRFHEAAREPKFSTIGAWWKMQNARESVNLEND